jgi:hypothetical protein
VYRTAETSGRGYHQSAILALPGIYCATDGIQKGIFDNRKHERNHVQGNFQVDPRK